MSDKKLKLAVEQAVVEVLWGTTEGLAGQAHRIHAATGVDVCHGATLTTVTVLADILESIRLQAKRAEPGEFVSVEEFKIALVKGTQIARAKSEHSSSPPPRPEPPAPEPTQTEVEAIFAGLRKQFIN